MELCATFVVGKKYMFLFPWAEGGSLADLWKKEPAGLLSDIRSETSVLNQWIAVQCHGLVQDLYGIHGFLDEKMPEKKGLPFFGIHGDIKPENILHFSQDEDHELGCLKLSDFGMLQFHRRESRSRPSLIKTVFGQTYRAPEQEIGGLNPISRKVDIWALGCAFSDFLTWAIRGKTAIGDFADVRYREPANLPINPKTPWNEDNFYMKDYRKKPFFLGCALKHERVSKTPTPRLKASVTKVGALYHEFSLLSLTSCSGLRIFLKKSSTAGKRPISWRNFSSISRNTC